MASTARPVFSGLLVYRHLGHRFSLLYPEGWHQAKAPRAAGGGVVFSPDPEDLHTSVLVQSRRLPSAVEPADLPALRDGMLEGIRQLPGAAIEEQKAEAVADRLLDAEAKHTYRDPEAGVVRKRWIRLLCQGSVQVSIVCQGSSEERYAYWLPMFNTVMRTVKFADWWAEATGHSWRKTLDAPVD
ncbi:MAG TPA: hypothetical protein VFX49_23300 [Chloroflexota bacterium]|nr:hypothetical protein [Chloroflexota bacterium]